MATLPDFDAAEARFRSLLDREGFAQPDRVERTDTSLWFYWDEEKVVIQVDLVEGRVSDRPR